MPPLSRTPVFTLAPLGSPRRLSLTQVAAQAECNVNFHHGFAEHSSAIRCLSRLLFLLSLSLSLSFTFAFPLTSFLKDVPAAAIFLALGEGARWIICHLSVFYCFIQTTCPFFFFFLDLKTPSYSRNRHDGSMENNRKAAPGASDACRVSCIWLLPVCNLYLFFFNVKTDMTVAVTQALQSCLLRRHCPPAEYLHKLLQSGRGSVHPERRGENGMQDGKK